ncbi:MAG: aldehyde dehydrogenase family protein [Acidobacteriota bacterium]
MSAPLRALIDGELVAGAGTLAVARKDKGELLAQAPLCDEAEIERAAAAATRAFATTRSLAGFERAEILRRIRDGIAARKDELARTLALEAGKPIRAARAEIDRALHTFACSAEEATRIHGDLLPLDSAPHARGRSGMLRRFPVGPVAGITPFNFPLNLVAHKVGPAIAAGCSIVLKPASATPLSALALGEIVAASGAAPGSVNVVPCPSALGEKLAVDPRFAALTFTGSAAVGWRLRAIAGRKRVVLELGGNAAVIVHDDADLAVAIPKIVAGAFGYAGQSCISVQRILVQRRIVPDVARELVVKTEGLKVGDVLAEDTDIGPMIDEDAARKTESSIQDAVRSGAKLLTGGDRRGAWVTPALLQDVPHDCGLWCQEAFAPVAVIEAYDTWDQALALCNASDFGLQAGIFTRDFGRIMQAYDVLEVGGVMVGEVPTWRVDPMPYGGTKGSGIGREGVRYAIEDLTEPKLLVWSR